MNDHRSPAEEDFDTDGEEHSPYVGDVEALVGEVEEFLIGARGEPHDDRVLATVMFCDLVDSTERAAALGDARWAEVLDAHNHAVRRQLERFRGVEVNTTGVGFVGTFDGPARAIRGASGSARRSRHWAFSCASGSTRARSCGSAQTSAASPFT